MTTRLLLVGALALSSCDAVFPRNCTAEAIPAVEVIILDAATGAPAACDALLVARDGAYVDSVSVRRWFGLAPGDTTNVCRVYQTLNQLEAAYERPGTYSLRVEKPGFAPWERSGVRVRSTFCHVQTARFEVRLARASPKHAG